MRSVLRPFAVLSLLAGSAPVYADLYGGITAGPMLVDVSRVSNPVNVGGVIGYELDDGFAVEAVATTSVARGRARGPALPRGSVRITTVGGYGAWRSDGTIYVKGKVGVVYEDVKIGRSSDDDLGLSAGAGVGYRFSGGQRVEGEFTLIESDVNFLSVTLLF